MNRVIEVIVSPKGETTVQTKGFAGSACLAASKFIEDALGVSSRERRTPEFFTVGQIERQQINQ